MTRSQMRASAWLDLCLAGDGCDVESAMRRLDSMQHHEATDPHAPRPPNASAVALAPVNPSPPTFLVMQ